MKEENFNLRDYVEHEAVFIRDCLEKQLEATPHIKRDEFIEQDFVGRGYANKYLEYYLGRRHKPTYEVRYGA